MVRLATAWQRVQWAGTLLVDDKLQPIFGGKKLDKFQVTKTVNKH
jgi:hypothetical protein